MFHMNASIIALFITIVWIYIWVDLVRSTKSDGVIRESVPSIKVVGTALLLTIAVFYTTLYTSYTHLFTLDAYTQSLALLMLLVGARVVVGARRHMQHLTPKEVLFSINHTHSEAGVYRILKHPMYTGIGIILVTSWVLLPNVVPGVLLLMALSLLCAKAVVETRASKK